MIETSHNDGMAEKEIVMEVDSIRDLTEEQENEVLNPSRPNTPGLLTASLEPKEKPRACGNDFHMTLVDCIPRGGNCPS